jgi:glycine/sarcosine N-methyltransferase
MREADPYRGFAERYDAFGKGSPERRAFFEGLFRRNGVRSVLDCACGTGGDLLLFRSLGCDVVGSDLSEAMLGRARERLRTAEAEIPLVRADFRHLPRAVAGPFDAVVCLSTSLPHLHDEAEIVRSLESMRAVLRDGGILVLDQGMTDRQWTEKPRFIPAINTPEFSRLMAIDYTEETFVVHVIDFLEEDGERAFHVDRFVYRALLRDDYDRLLRVAGFRDVEFLGGFDGRPYDRVQSRRMIVVARS